MEPGKRTAKANLEKSINLSLSTTPSKNEDIVALATPEPLYQAAKKCRQVHSQDTARQKAKPAS